MGWWTATPAGKASFRDWATITLELFGGRQSGHIGWPLVGPRGKYLSFKLETIPAQFPEFPKLFPE